MLNSREWAILTLLIIFAIVVLSTPSTRKHVLQLLRGASSGVIVIPLVALTVWVAVLVTGASHLGLWNSGLAKDTVVWFVVSGFGTIFAALRGVLTRRGDVIGATAR